MKITFPMLSDPESKDDRGLPHPQRGRPRQGGGRAPIRVPSSSISEGVIRAKLFLEELPRPPHDGRVDPRPPGRSPERSSDLPSSSITERAMRRQPTRPPKPVARAGRGPSGREIGRRPPRPRRPCPAGRHGRTRRPIYIPVATRARRPIGRIRAAESAEGRDFLDPPRAAGELGWLAHYRVRRLLGEGGMGLVYEAEDTDLLRPVALKVIRPELGGIPQVAQRFLREARAMAALKHDHIVTIYQVGQQHGVPFLAMEYLRGMSLHRWLDRGHKPSVDLVLRLGREIAAGLAAAHQRGLIHRDIKPANIWLEAPDGPGQDPRLRAGPGRRDATCRSRIRDRPWAPRRTWPRSRRAASGGDATLRPVQPRVRALPALHPTVAVPGDDGHGRADVPVDGYAAAPPARSTPPCRRPWTI